MAKDTNMLQGKNLLSSRWQLGVKRIVFLVLLLFPARNLPAFSQEREFLLIADAEKHPSVVQSLNVLYPGRLEVPPRAGCGQLENRRAIIVVSYSPVVELEDLQGVEAFARRGGKVVMDLAVYAKLRGLEIKETSLDEQSAQLEVIREHPATKGFKPGDTIPWYGVDVTAAGAKTNAKRQVTQRSLTGVAADAVLARAADSGALLIAEKLADGAILATDLTSLPEPVFSVPGSFNKYLFLGNFLGQSVRYGQHYPARLTYAEFVEEMKGLCARYPAIRMRDEGGACGERRMYSLELGDETKPAFLVYAATHGSEWEPAYGLLTLAQRLASGELSHAFDFGRYRLELVPIVNPSGYDLFTRQNANKVDPNRNMSVGWEDYRGKSTPEKPYGPGSYDWKGTAPFSEPETQTMRAVFERLRPHAALDIHGNRGGDGENRLFILPGIRNPDLHYANEACAREAARLFNAAFSDRYVLREAGRPGVQQYNVEAIWNDSRGKPTLLNDLGVRNVPSLTVECPAIYKGTYATVFNTDLVVETCLAFFKAYQVDFPAANPVFSSPETINPAQLRPAPGCAPAAACSFAHARVWAKWAAPAFLVYAEAGAEVALTIQHRDVTDKTKEGDPLTFTVTAPGGSVTLSQEIPFRVPTRLTFRAGETGAYRITSRPGSRAVVTIEDSTNAVNLDMGGERVLLRGAAGDFYFWVPAGTVEFSVRFYGQHSTGAAVRLYGADGTVWEDAGETMQHKFDVRLPRPSTGEAWKLYIARPEKMRFGGQFVELLGIPALLAPSRESLLMPILDDAGSTSQSSATVRDE